MKIRKAQIKDISALNRLLIQINRLHAEKRNDLFRLGVKYTNEEIAKMINNKNYIIFCAVNEQDEVVGYAMCKFIQYLNHSIVTDVKTLFIDDLCVDEKMRRQHIGTDLLDYVMKFAKEHHCYNVTLNVWKLNENAINFYKHYGLEIQKIRLEKIL